MEAADADDGAHFTRTDSNKRKRQGGEDADADGAEDKRASGLPVPQVPQSEGGIPCGKRVHHRYRDRPFPVLSAASAHERLQTCLVSTFGELTNKEDVLKRFDEVLYLSYDVAQECPALKTLIHKLDVGWEMRDTLGYTIFTLEDDMALDKLPHIAQWLIEIDSWNLVINHMFRECKITDAEFVHPSLPHIDPVEWRRTVTAIMKKVWYLWKRYKEQPEAPPTYDCNWRE